MMEPDSRIETNRTGFCSTHFAKLYNLQQNRLPLALVIDTHMSEQIKALEDIYKKHEGVLLKETEKGLFNSALDTMKGKKSTITKTIKELLEMLETLESTCAVCDRVNNNMDRLIDNTIYLYTKEPDFKEKFHASKGFCLKHLKMLLIKGKKEFSQPSQGEFLLSFLPMEIEMLKRVLGDVNHFIKMFDYLNKEADWKNSRDAIPRSIEKIVGPCELKR